MKKLSILLGLFVMFMSPCVNSQQVDDDKNRISAKVYYEFLEDSGCTPETDDCRHKKFLTVRKIPNVEFTDYETEDGKDYIFLMITNKKLTTKKLITSIINRSNLIKVTNIVMPVPVDTTPYKDPYEGMSQEEIRKAYDDYYKENPDLKPDNW